MSADTFEFDDKNHAERFVGTLHDPQATVGDVLTVQADKSIAAKPGGGSMPLDYAVVSLSADAEGSAPVPFDTVVTDVSGYYQLDSHVFTVPAGKGGMYLLGTNLIAKSKNGLIIRVSADWTVPVYPNINYNLAPTAGDATLWEGGSTGLTLLMDGDIVAPGCAIEDGADGLCVFTGGGNGCYAWIIRLGAAPS